MFIADKDSVKYRGATDAVIAAAQRRAREHFGKARETILQIDGEFTRTTVKNQRLVRSGTTTIHYACKQLLEEGLIELVRKQGKNEFYRVVNHGQQKAA